MGSSNYNFKKEASLYLVDGTSQYNIDISEISFNQTTSERSFPTKTLHSANNFESSKITKANPANFSFVLPVLREADMEIVVSKLLDCTAFDLYVETHKDVFKIRNAVITNGAFVIERLKPLSLAISGEASEVSLEGDVDVVTIPGTYVPRSGTRTYNRINYVLVDFGNTTEALSGGVRTMNITLQNNVKWTPNSTIGLCNPSSQEITYPETFVIDSRRLSGSIVKYLTDLNNADLFSYSEDTTLTILVGEDVGGAVYGFQFDISNCAYTNKLNTDNVFSQTYDWTMVQNPTNLSDVISYFTIT